MTSGAYILAPLGQDLAAEEAAFFREADPWGFILFARNVDTPEQLRRLTGDLRDAVGRDAAILIDQEGGRVQRMRAPHWHEWLPPLEEVAAHGVAGLAARYAVIAAELRAVGIDANCAPCADIAQAETHPFLRNRCYGEDVGTVTDAARAVAAAHLGGGVLPVLKHMPGHGRAVAGSHLAVPMVEVGPEELAETDFAPFRALADLPLAMTAHILFSEIDPAAPATTSPDMIRLIREEIGFGGLLMTDDISMHALRGPLSARAHGSIRAGCDVVLHCNGDLGEMGEVAKASGRMSADSAARGDAALAARLPDPGLDAATLLGEYSALVEAIHA